MITFFIIILSIVFIGFIIYILRIAKIESELSQRREARAPSAVIIVSRRFKYVFVSICFLTFASLAVSIFLSVNFTELNVLHERLFEACTTTWKMGFGAILGLIGGKTF